MSQQQRNYQVLKMKNNVKKIKAEEIIYKGSKGLFINGEKYGAGITKIEIIGPNEINIYAVKFYKKEEIYENNFHKYINIILKIDVNW